MNMFSRGIVLFFICSVFFISGLKAQAQLKLSLNATKVIGDTWISGNVAIPASSSTSVTVDLSYSGTGASLLNKPPIKVVIPAGELKVDFVIDVINVPSSDRVLNITASAVNYAASSAVSATLVRNIQPSKAITLSTTSYKMLDDQKISIKVKIPEVNQGFDPIQVMLYYSGDGASFIRDTGYWPKHTSVLIQPGRDEVEFQIYINDIVGESDKKLTISAKANGYSQYSNTLDIKLLRTEIKSSTGILSFPDLPQIKVENGKVVAHLSQTTKARSSNELKGVWIACKLAVDRYIFDGRPFFFWVPLDNCGLRYHAYASYKMDGYGGYLLTNNEQKNIKFGDKKGYALKKRPNLAQNKPNIYFNTLERELYEHLDNAKLGLAAIGGLSPTGTDITNYFGFRLGDARQVDMTNVSTSVNDLITSSTEFIDRERLAQGPSTAGYRKAIAHFSPQIFYHLGDANGKLENIDIKSYISADKISSYIRSVLSSSTSLMEYLKKYPLVDELNNGFNDRKCTVPVAPHKVWDDGTNRNIWEVMNEKHGISVHSYAIALYDCRVNYGDLDKYNVEKEFSLVEEKDQSVINLYTLPIALKPTSQPTVSLTATRTELTAGSSTTVTLTYNPTDSRAVGKVRIRLGYEGSQAHLVEGPGVVEIDTRNKVDGGIAVPFAINVKSNYNLSDHKKVKIVAKTLGQDNRVERLGELVFTLKSDQYTIREMVSDELAFPELPKLHFEKNMVELTSRERIVSMSKKVPDGVFVECKLKARFTKDGQTMHKYLSTDGLYGYAVDVKPIYFWVPLKNTNSFRYRAACEYKLGNTDVLRYQEGLNVQNSYSTRTNYQTSNNRFDEQFQEIHRENGSGGERLTTSSISMLDEINEGKSGGQVTGTAINFNFPGYGVPFSGDFWTNSSRNNHRNQTKSITHFNSSIARAWMDSKLGYRVNNRQGQTFTESEGSDVAVQHSSNISKIGPLVPHFVKVYGFVQPSVTYALIDPSDEDSELKLESIEKYIDYDGMDFLGSVRPKNIKEYVQEIMRPPAPNHINETLNHYLVKYPQVVTVNKSLSNIYDDIKKNKSVTAYTLNSIEVDSYSFNITDFRAPYGAVFLCETYPISCTSIAITPTVSIGSGEPSFTWEASSSATEFKLQVQKKGGDWTTLILNEVIMRTYNSQNEPTPPIYKDDKSAYGIDEVYEARIQVKCGASGEWLSQYSPIVTFVPLPKSTYSVNNIKGEQQADGSYVITWDPVPGAQGYNVQYATTSETFEEARVRINAFGQGHPFDEKRYNGPKGTTFIHRSGEDFRIRVSAVCHNHKGPMTESGTFPVCPAVLEKPTVRINQDQNPVFSWKVSPVTEKVVILIKKTGESWSSEKGILAVTVTKDPGVPLPSEVVDVFTNYDRASKYVFRLVTYCKSSGVGNSSVGGGGNFPFSLGNSISLGKGNTVFSGGIDYPFGDVPFEFDHVGGRVCASATSSLTINIDHENKAEFEWEQGVNSIFYKIDVRKKSSKKIFRTNPNIQFESNIDPEDLTQIYNDSIPYGVGSYEARVLVRCRENPGTWCPLTVWESFSVTSINDPQRNTNNGPERPIEASLSMVDHSLSTSASASSETESARLSPELLIAPNPVSNYICFSIKNIEKPIEKGKALIQVHNVNTGRVVYSKKWPHIIQKGESVVINESLLQGQYILEVVLDDQCRLTKQLIKE
ncbi:MAG: T9SS type A sorting domain-containing protein [Pedobacter sp.]|nr:MAG: T9SS type A sorting domain-containing protein [Pedobacter sp.]